MSIVTPPTPEAGAMNTIKAPALNTRDTTPKSAINRKGLLGATTAGMELTPGPRQAPRSSPQPDKSKGGNGDSSGGGKSSKLQQGRSNTRDHANSGDGSDHATVEHRAPPRGQASASSVEEEPVYLARPGIKHVDIFLARIRRQVSPVFARGRFSHRSPSCITTL